MALITIHDPDTGYVVELDHWEGAVHWTSYDDPQLATRTAKAQISVSPAGARALAANLTHLAAEIGGC